MAEFVAGEICKHLMSVRVTVGAIHRLLQETDANKAHVRLVNEMLEAANGLEDLLLSEVSERA
jgi:hypothetical protein